MNATWNNILQFARTEEHRFGEASENPVNTQREILRQIVDQNRNTEFGRLNRFEDIKGPGSYRDKVHANGYEDLNPFIEKAAMGKTNQLTHSDVILFEETSGSTNGKKIVPYTAPALKAFRAALLPWITDTLKHNPEIGLGRAYWAISPAMRPFQKTPGGIPIGVTNDAVYFGEKIGEGIQHLSVAGEECVRAKTFTEWRYLTALALLRASDLSLISIWSPTFMFPILETIITFKNELINDLAKGTPQEQVRAIELEKFFSCDRLNSEEIWPSLKVLSCWTHATSKNYASLLKDYFPQAHMQGKGLLATEGVVSIPLHDYPYPVLAINSGFFEFVDMNGNTVLCDGLVEGEIYKVLITTFSGLYRYNLGDQVRMRGMAKPGLPMLEFIGRANRTSDLVGEKLDENFVESCLVEIPGFRMLVPESSSDIPGYTLVVDEKTIQNERLQEIKKDIECKLRRNPQYDYARNLNQLGEIEILPTDKPLEKYIDMSLVRECRVSDIKLTPLWVGSPVLNKYRNEGEIVR